MNVEQRNKFMQVLTSRKFWFTVIGMLSAVGLVQFNDTQSAQMAGEIVAGLTAVLVVAQGLVDAFSKPSVPQIAPPAPVEQKAE